VIVLGSGTPSFAAPGGPPGGDSSPALPQVPQALSANSGCTAASTQSTDRVPWAQSTLRLDAAWQFTEGGGVLVGVVDTGVDDSAPALAGQVTAAGKDCVGHGTFAAGLIAGKRLPGIGFSGVAPAAHIYAASGTDRAGGATNQSVANGIRAAVDAGCRIVLVSPSLSAPSEVLSQAVSYATAHGVLLIAPATAGGQKTNGQSYPAEYPDVLSVGDVGPGDSLPQGAESGSRVDLVAPGDAVVSVGPGGPHYFTGSGAAFAAAVVAGTAALVDAYRPGLTPAQLRDRLTATAYHPGTAMPEAQRGYGLVDLVAAVTTVLPEEFGNAGGVPLAAAQPATMPTPQPPANSTSALAIAGGAVLVMLLVAGLAVTLPRGRRRHWRPARGAAQAGSGDE
jgi:hypothetical protein